MIAPCPIWAPVLIGMVSSGKHVNDAIFLHVTPIFNNYFTPTTKSGSGTDITIFAYDNIAALAQADE
jgi:hypothetical protein